MATNGTDYALETKHGLDTALARKRTLEDRVLHAEHQTPANVAERTASDEDFVLAPLVDQIAYGIARGLVVAVKQLENHIASETRKVGDSVDRRLDALQVTLQDLSRFMAEQRTMNAGVQEQLHELQTAGAALREVDTRQAADLDALRNQTVELATSVTQKIDAAHASLQQADAQQAAELETFRTETKTAATAVSQRIDTVVTSLQEADNAVSQRLDTAVAALQEADTRTAESLTALRDETKAASQSLSERLDTLCKDFGIQQEDIAAAKATLSTVCGRIDGLVERLDRQGDAVRSMYSAYSQRETELERLVDGLARLRAHPTLMPTSAL